MLYWLSVLVDGRCHPIFETRLAYFLRHDPGGCHVAGFVERPGEALPALGAASEARAHASGSFFLLEQF